jgi:NTE family protein
MMLSCAYTRLRRHAVVAVMFAIHAGPLVAQDTTVRRPRVGVAFGGGSALGLAHVGVIRWFETHHVPIDLVAGTSMGGLVGGAFAAGMSSSEIARMIEATDWTEMFSSSAYRYKTIARKEDARAYPSRLELEVRGRAALPSALNNGQRVDLFLPVSARCTRASRASIPCPPRFAALRSIC